MSVLVTVVCICGFRSSVLCIVRILNNLNWGFMQLYIESIFLAWLGGIAEPFPFLSDSRLGKTTKEKNLFN